MIMWQSKKENIWRKNLDLEDDYRMWIRGLSEDDYDHGCKEYTEDIENRN